ncbi:MAG: adenylate cyclase [Clostridia bacterium]|jgi:hypothetical protein|nr:adenylate cyclase [Clostridia bacterium]
MTFKIKDTNDAFKFALSLYDYLSKNGYSEEAKILGNLVDDCFSSDEEAQKAHWKAFKEIKGKVPDLPKKYQIALEESLEIL